MFLVEKATTNQWCQFYRIVITVGDVVIRLGCNHVAHLGCFDPLGGFFSCGEHHTIDDRYSMRILVQHNSDANRRVGNAQAFPSKSRECVILIPLSYLMLIVVGFSELAHPRHYHRQLRTNFGSRSILTVVDIFPSVGRPFSTKTVFHVFVLDASIKIVLFAQNVTKQPVMELKCGG